MISDIEHDFIYIKYTTLNKLEKKHLGLLTETHELHEVLLWLIKTPNIHVFKMAAPTEDRFPHTIL